ncbi:MAG: hypothetical protein ACYDCC_03125 [Actinomycetota bacterium]
MRKQILRIAAVASMAIAGIMPHTSQAASLPSTVHVFSVVGTSSFGGSTYQYAQSGVTDGSGIHRPSGFSSTTGQPLASGKGFCNLVWDTGGLLTHECAGLLTADTGLTGDVCVGDTDPNPVGSGSCRLRATTWFYGYCGDTYGGDPNGGGTFFWNGQLWTIARLGFPAGQSDTWEFNGLLTRGANTMYMRLYLTAAPNKLGEQAGCGSFLGAPPATSITFAGTVILSDQPLPRAYSNLSGASGTGWYSCDGTTQYTNPTSGKNYVC